MESGAVEPGDVVRLRGVRRPGWARLLVDALALDEAKNDSANALSRLSPVDTSAQYATPADDYDVRLSVGRTEQAS
jgi:hypothetical protein